MKANAVSGLILLVVLLTGSTRAQDSGLRRTVKAGKGGDLSVSVIEGNVRVSGWDRDEVTVRVNGASEEDENCLNVLQHGNSIHVSVRGGCDFSELEIRVPSKFNVEIQSASGDIEVDGPLSGTIKGSTSGGGIRLGALGGRVDMQTAGGDVSSDDIQGDVRLATQGGDVRVGKVSGETDISSAGGDITIAGSGRRLRAATSGGNVTIGDVGADAEVETTGGDVQVGDVAGTASIETAGGNITLRSARGSTSASTAGGDIRLESVTGSVRAETAGGNVVARLTPRGASTLTSYGGEIRLFLPADAKVTVKASVDLSDNDDDSDVGIVADFPIENPVRSDGGAVLQGTIVVNGGGETIRLETRDGRIEVRKGKIRE